MLLWGHTVPRLSAPCGRFQDHFHFLWYFFLLAWLPASPTNKTSLDGRNFQCRSWSRQKTPEERTDCCNLLTIFLFIVLNGTRKCFKSRINGALEKGLWPRETVPWGRGLHGRLPRWGPSVHGVVQFIAAKGRPSSNGGCYPARKTIMLLADRHKLRAIIDT